MTSHFLIGLAIYLIIGLVCLVIAIMNTWGKKIHEFIYYQPRNSAIFILVWPAWLLLMLLKTF